MAKKRESSVSEALSQDEGKLEMTPMIDVTFNLLIFFMCNITFQVLEGQISAELPTNTGLRTVTSQSEPEKPQALLIRLDKNDESAIYNFGNKTTTRDPEELAAAIHRAVRRLPNLKISISPDSNVPYKYLIEAMTACRKAEASNIQFASGAVFSNQ